MANPSRPAKRWEGRVTDVTGSELRRMLGPGPHERRDCAEGNACVQASEDYAELPPFTRGAAGPNDPIH